MEPTTKKLAAADGTDIKVLGLATIPAEAYGSEFQVTGYVSDQISEVILGVDFLDEHDALWDFARAEITLDGRRHRLRSHQRSGWVRRVVADDTFIIPSRSEAVVSSYVMFNGPPGPCKNSAGGWITQTSEPVTGLYVSRAVLPERSLEVPVRVLNITQSDVILPAGTVLTNLEQVDGTTDVALLTEEDALAEARAELIDDLVERVDDSISEDVRRQLRRLLSGFSSVFSTGDNDLGRTAVTKHEIHTGDARPIRQPLRRHPPAHAVAIKEHVEAMLQQGVIEKAQSPWASNIVLVRKKDGSLRCCVDYRQLNKVTTKDAYPLPRIDVCLDTMSGAQWFSTFDFRSSYHQVEVQPEDTDKTAFICREGLFKFITMPFGLCGAPATFQRLMDVAMAGLTYEICLVYLDDIIVFSSTLEEHLQRLALVLDRISSSGLKIKVSKTNLLKRSVAFLGHIVSSHGIGTQMEKIEAVMNWPVPQDVHDV
jgi:hypothetical protein